MALVTTHAIQYLTAALAEGFTAVDIGLVIVAMTDCVGVDRIAAGDG